MILVLTDTAREGKSTGASSLLAGEEAENEDEDNDAANRTGQYR